MKTILALFIVCGSLLVASAGAQSLGDIARQSRAKKDPNAPKKVYDNENMPTEGGISIAAVSVPKEEKEGEEASKKKEEGKEEGKKEEKKETSEDWKKKIDEQKKEVTQLQRELDVAEREARLRAAAYYADAGTRLRDETKFAEDTRKEQAEIDAKKQALAAAKQKLDDLLEQSRKAGVPSGQLD